MVDSKKKAEYLKIAFGQAVRNIRTRRCLSQEKLAELADLHMNYISSVERGERNITLVNICKIARGLDTHPCDLFLHLSYPFKFSKDST